MTTVPEITRRRVLQALGVGAAGSLAGCATLSDDGPATPTEPSVDDPQSPDIDRIAADPTEVPDPIDRSSPATVEVELETRELVAEIEPDVTYTAMTFDGRIPGPLIRVRRGDTVDLTITSHEDNLMPHNIDLHAVRGPGGGAAASMVAPGETERFRFKATYPGAFIYHCAVPDLDYHISSGMFGLILVEPQDGLPAVDHEFYFGQHELYTTGNAGQAGHHDFDMDAMADENPTYVLANGEKYAITEDGYGPVSVDVGDTARVFFVNGGPNLTSSFHPIGSVWDAVRPQGAIGAQPQQNVQTTPVMPGSSAITTLQFSVPGPVKLVDHALSRVARKGFSAVIEADGEPRLDIFDPDPA
ncbi:copper-containing nitrite reductase [Halapricum hydrolyticum]|uniref:Copper-containing nitrite reductase n=1 Tax=Halapricum hydrolyticum TaxID=2979991 RepID=A0AAE3I888_9EURY|nr:copper-containing nitrite reductase [Halapricum hydrolyticum]MCU4716937.1 copper-containing nitrite reductase [Halapricum hydrolyticum]MCU4725458.1 copper-containing nitrite reductase [Halapricum hydrolyticum]